MLSDEEKEAIEWLKRLVKLNKRDNLDDTFAEILLNLIEKQSKEIEELKEKNKKCEYYEMVSDELYKNSISKDKIKAEIEEIGNMKVEGGTFITAVNFAVKILQSLLEKE